MRASQTIKSKLFKLKFPYELELVRVCFEVDGNNIGLLEKVEPIVLHEMQKQGIAMVYDKYFLIIPDICARKGTMKHPSPDMSSDVTRQAVYDRFNGKCKHCRKKVVGDLCDIVQTPTVYFREAFVAHPDCSPKTRNNTDKYKEWFDIYKKHFYTDYPYNAHFMRSTAKELEEKYGEVCAKNGWYRFVSSMPAKNWEYASIRAYQGKIDKYIDKPSEFRIESS